MKLSNDEKEQILNDVQAERVFLNEAGLDPESLHYRIIQLESKLEKLIAESGKDLC